MKKINKYLLIAIVSLGTVFYSCETLELEQLTSPNALSPDKANASLLLNTIQLDYWGAVAQFNDNGAALARIDYLFGRNYFNALGPATLNFAWGNLYSDMIPDIANIESLHSAENNLSFHLGASKVMQAHLMMLMVDYIGDIVWSESNNPTEFPTPKLDDDAAVYAAAIGILAEAKGYLNGATAGTAQDLFYGGSAAKWTKLANTLLMRADLSVGNYQAVINAPVANLIQTEAEDFEFKFGTNELQPDTRHPDYAADYRSDGANIYQSNWLMNLMAGDSDEWYNLWGVWQPGDPFPSNDPRRRYYFYRQAWNTPGSFSMLYHSSAGTGAWPAFFGADGTNGETLQCSLQSTPTHLEFTPDEEVWCSIKLGYWGRSHGNDEGTPPDNFLRTASGVYPAGGSFDNQEDIPFYQGGSGVGNLPHGAVGLGQGAKGFGIEPIMLSSYVDFMKAEANLALGNTGAAATLLQSGMTKSIAKVMSFGANDATANSDLFPTAGEVSAYISEIVANFNAATASGLDGQGYPVSKDKMDILGEQYFIALFGGSADAFNFIRRTGYPRTLTRSVEANPGAFPRSFLYPNNENIANPNVTQKPNLSSKVFWDAGILNPAN